MTTTSWVEVVAAVIERSDGSFLLAERPPGKAYAGYWEFPGGKLEAGESLQEALRRELKEELDIEVEQAYPWITRTFVYPHASVRLNFHRVGRWRGQPLGREGQRFSWQRIDALSVAPILPANGPVLKALSLPLVYAISKGEAGEFDLLRAEFDKATERGLKLAQLREKQIPLEACRSLGRAMLNALNSRNGLLVVNSDCAGGRGSEIAREIGAHGVHLTAVALNSASARPPFEWVGASCHDAAELRRASELGADFAVLGPVHATTSHPAAKPIGWGKFRALALGCPLPLFAIGGLLPSDLEIARQHGAHGIAMRSAAWVTTAN